VPAKPSALVDTRIIYCGDTLELPDGFVDLIHIDPPFNSNRNYEVFWDKPKGDTHSKTGSRTHEIYGDKTRSAE
jgi:DNA modification methylase